MTDDHALDRTYYRSVPPAPGLAHLVECLWVRVAAGTKADDDRRILPDGRMDLVWIRELGVVVAGPQSRYTTRPAVAPMLAFGARFHPGVAPILLRLPAVEFVDDHVPLSAVNPRMAARLGRMLATATDERDAFRILNRELARLTENLQPDPAVREAVTLLEQRTNSISEIAASVFLSERQLQRRFIEHVGYGPKTLQRILRLQDVVRQLESRHDRIELGRTAASAGYADQSHLTRESRQLTGLTPQQLAHWLT